MSQDLFRKLPPPEDDPDVPPILKQITDLSRADLERGRELTPEEIRSRLALAKRLLDEAPSEALVHALTLAFDGDLDFWLQSLLASLGRIGLVDEAVSLARRLSKAVDDPTYEAEAVAVLARAGRRDEALREADQFLKGECGGPLPLAVVAEAMVALGETAKAQLLYRLASTLEEDPEDRKMHLESEIPLLRLLGRADEAAALEAILPEIGEPEFEDGELSDDDDEPEEEPPPARNAPCPCGSGKKYKRCCGKT